jgi:hypothetical protein
MYHGEVKMRVTVAMPIGALLSIERGSTDFEIDTGTVPPPRLYNASGLALTVAGVLCTGLLPLFPPVERQKKEGEQ